MRIGIPREILAGETRVASTPEVVKRLVKTGFDVWVEVGAWVSAHYPDIQYEEAGARLVARAEALAANILLRVRKPTLGEVAAMTGGAVYTGLIETCGEGPALQAMHAKGIRVLGMERMPRISRAQSMDALCSQSNIAGYRTVIEAAAR